MPIVTCAVRQGGAESTYPWGSTADDQARGLPMRSRTNRKTCRSKFWLSRFAASLDCSGTHERRHRRRWPPIAVWV